MPTSTPGNVSRPAWSPDCEWIAFTSARGGFKDESALHPINPQPYEDPYVMRADGSDVRRLTDNEFEDGTPTWIPNKPNSNPGPRKWPSTFALDIDEIGRPSRCAIVASRGPPAHDDPSHDRGAD